MALHPPPIGEYTPTVPVQEGLRRVIPEERGISGGPGIAEFGGAVQKVAISEAANYTANALSATQSQWTEHLRTAAEQAPPGAPGFTNSLEKQYGQYVAQTLKDAPNDLARKMLQQHLTSFGGELLNRSMQFEAAAREKHNQDTGELLVQTAGNHLQEHPEDFGSRLTDNASLIEALNLNPQEKDALQIRNKTELARNATLGSIQQDPYGAQMELLHPTRAYTAMLPPEMREQLMGKADEAIRSRLSQAEQLDRMAKQQNAAQQDQIIKDGLKLSESHQLTAAWVNQHSDLLTHEQMKGLLDEARGRKENVVSDPHAIVDLTSRFANGEDVREDAQQDYLSDRISKADYLKYAGKPPQWFKNGTEFIKGALQPDLMNPDPARATSRANALNDWNDWRLSNPNAKPEDAEKEYQSIADRYQLIDANRSILTLPVPRFAVGPRTKLDLQATEAATLKAAQSGQLSEQEAQSQALLLQRWEKAMNTLNTNARPTPKQ